MPAQAHCNQLLAQACKVHIPVINAREGQQVAGRKPASQKNDPQAPNHRKNFSMDHQKVP